jgi:hypothetical protein
MRLDCIRSLMVAYDTPTQFYCHVESCVTSIVQVRCEFDIAIVQENTYHTSLNYPLRLPPQSANSFYVRNANAAAEKVHAPGQLPECRLYVVTVSALMGQPSSSNGSRCL